MWIGIISLFPNMFRIITEYGIVRKAIKKNLLKLKCWNPRDFSCKKNLSVDDRPYGGGPGMIMLAKPISDAIFSAKKKIGKEAKVIYLSPQGRILNFHNIKELIRNEKLILVCGRYKGIDERLILTQIDEEWSIGDYILSGGELAAMVLIDSICRYIPGVIKNEQSLKTDSFYTGLLDCQYYTRPKTIFGISVPSVLLSGHHLEIKKWRFKQSLERTYVRRPDLIKFLKLNNEQIFLLKKFSENKKNKI